MLEGALQIVKHYIASLGGRVSCGYKAPDTGVLESGCRPRDVAATHGAPTLEWNKRSGSGERLANGNGCTALVTTTILPFNEELHSGLVPGGA